VEIGLGERVRRKARNLFNKECKEMFVMAERN
jgi:hypothetical protein